MTVALSGGSSWTRRPRPRRSWCCGRSGRTTSCSARTPPRPVEERCAADSPLRRPRAGRPASPPGRCARQPKQLDRGAEPLRARPRRRAGVLSGRSDRARADAARPQRVDHRAHRRAGRAGRAADAAGPSTPEVRARARQIASRLAVPRPRRDPAAGAGPRRARSACRTGAVRTTSTSTARSRCSPSGRCPRRRTSSSGSGYAPGARSCSRSTSPARCAASGSAPPPRPSARWPASCGGTTSRWSRSGPTRPCCSGWARRCGRCGCSTSCSRSRPGG